MVANGRFRHGRYPDTFPLELSGYTELQSIADAINHGAIYKLLTKSWKGALLREHIQEVFMFYKSRCNNLQKTAAAAQGI